MTGDIVLADARSNGTLALRSDQQAWTDTQRAALAQIGVADAPEGDLAVFLHVSQRSGLDPFSKQIYMIGREDRRESRVKWTIQTGIDGFRIIAERHQQYAGQLEPQWCGDDGVWRDMWPGTKPPAAARVGVLRHDWPHPVYATVHFDEFAARYGNGGLMPMWSSKGAHMIGKVAEAHALRKAFPQDLSGMYTDDEMEHVSNPPKRVVLDHDAPQPVTVAELQAAPATDSGERMSQPQQRKLFALLRAAEVDNRNDYATTTLGRPVTSYGQLTAADADRLIGSLEADTQQPAPAVVTTPAAGADVQGSEGES